MRPYLDSCGKYIGRWQHMFGFNWGGNRKALKFPVEFDEGDRKIVQRIIEKKLSMAGHERLFATLLACRHVASNDIQGDFVECGVWRGGNGMIAADIFSRMKKSAKVCLFDTFSGMTEPEMHDIEIDTSEQASARYIREQKDAHNDWCFAPLEDVRQNFLEAGLLSNYICMIEGDVLETLRDEVNIPNAISVLRLDTDWYESTKLELEILWPRLQSGGILMVDDYGHWGGARKAVDEYFEERGRPFFHYIDYTGRMTVKP
jgi:O-methyltransferase